MLAKSHVLMLSILILVLPVPVLSATVLDGSKMKVTASDEHWRPALRSIDGTGMKGRLHDSHYDSMWWAKKTTGASPSGLTVTNGAWIKLDFDKVYRVTRIQIWNFNGTTPAESDARDYARTGDGFKDISIEYSVDGNTWTKLCDWRLARAPGDVDMKPSFDVEMDADRVKAKYIQITGHNNHGGVDIGLGEVRFEVIPESIHEAAAIPPVKYINPEVPRIELPAFSGKRYQSRVPDTLDFAARAKLAVNCLTRTTNPNADYEGYIWITLDHNPPFMKADCQSSQQAKLQEALPLMRLICGSDFNTHVGKRWMEVTLQMQGPDGLLYYPLIGRPWARIKHYDTIPDGDHYVIYWHNGRMLGALALYYRLTGDQRWLKAGQRLVDGLAKRVVDKGDYAYFTKWLTGEDDIPGPNAPMPDHMWTRYSYSYVALGAAQFHNVTGYKPALELSRKLANCTRRHCELFAEDGRWLSLTLGGDGQHHFHANCAVLLGMLEYAIAANDREMIDFVDGSFQWGMKHMWTQVGYVPEYFAENETRGSETCGVADVIHLGLKLTEAGVADYWDYVDRWVRNQFAENQLTNYECIYRMLELRSLPYDLGPRYEGARDLNARYTIERVPERCVGTFAGSPRANDWGGGTAQCCTGNGIRAIYYIWENILKYDDGHLKVNLLLNRASAWADVDSYLPYQGRVDFKIKEACELSIRIPEWVKAEDTQCSVNGEARKTSWQGRYAVVGKVNPENLVSLQFPIAERTEKLAGFLSGPAEFTLTFKGNTVVDIDPRGAYCPFYERERYRQDNVQWKDMEQFVADDIVKW